MKYLNIIFKVFIDVTKSFSLLQGIMILIVFVIGLLALLITAIQIFMPFTYIAF